MIPPAFDYRAAHSVEEAIALLTEHGDEAKLLAGGQSLIPAMRFRLASPGVLVDINAIGGLDHLHEQNGHLAIGAMLRESVLDDSQLVQQSFPLLADAARVIADPLVRNRATVGGNIAHADPANDHPAVMLAYDAMIVAQGPSGTRTIPIDDFFLGMFTTALEPEELLTEIRIPRPGANSGGAYIKLERKVGDYAVAAVAAQITMSGNTCTAARIALTNLNIVPMRALEAEKLLVGQELTDELLEAVGRAAAAECDPSADLRGSVEYKRDLTRVITKRAIRKAASRIQN
ncbi:MAG: xanthine dehydrogenase family protein subunit M [Oscillochloris sp.]|nr:xanthine dehydrogenase family protein subunit M [Oscillochloris sp.]